MQAGGTQPSESPGDDLCHPESSAAPFQTLPPNWMAQGWRLRSQLKGEGCYSSQDETGNTHQVSHPGSPPRSGLGNCFNGNVIWERHPKVPRALIALRTHLGLIAGALSEFRTLLQYTHIPGSWCLPGALGADSPPPLARHFLGCRHSWEAPPIAHLEDQWQDLSGVPSVTTGACWNDRLTLEVPGPLDLLLPPPSIPTAPGMRLPQWMERRTAVTA